MADVFTDMHRQLDGQITKEPELEERARRAVRKYAKTTPDPEEVEAVLMATLGLDERESA